MQYDVVSYSLLSASSLLWQMDVTKEEIEAKVSDAQGRCDTLTAEITALEVTENRPTHANHLLSEPFRATLIRRTPQTASSESSSLLLTLASLTSPCLPLLPTKTTKRPTEFISPSCSTPL